MSNMARLQAEFADADNVVLLSHSVTPESDSVSVLHAYFANADRGEASAGDDVFLHTERFFLVDQDRRMRGVYNGMNSAAVKQLMADVRTLRAETMTTAPPA